MATETLSTYVHQPFVEGRFIEVLGEKKAKTFISTLISICNGNPKLKECEPRSIVGAAGLAAITDLSISPSLGQAYIVPFKGKATFQIGTKGLIQLAHRTGRYVAYMRLVNGFEKTVYMTKAEVESHAEKYSQSYKTDKSKGYKSSPWSTNFDAMASKTVLKKLLNAWGILSADMAEALQADQAVVDRHSVTYVDNGNSTQAREDIFVPTDDTLTVDAETGEVINGGTGNATD